MASGRPENLVDLVDSEASKLGNFLSGLDQQAWTRSSACEGWTLGDVVAHLCGGADAWANSIARAVAGDAGPPPGQSFLPPGERGSQATAQAARSSRRQLGKQLLESYTAGYGRLSQVLSRLKAEDWEKPCFHRRGPMLLEDYVAVRVQELVVHGWDIRWGLDQTAELGPEALPVVVGRVPRWLSHAFSPGLALPAPTLYRFAVPGPVAVHQDILVNSDTFQAMPSGAGPADVSFRCNTGNYVLLLYGRLKVKEAIAAGRLSVQGRLDLADNLTAWFQGF